MKRYLIIPAATFSATIIAAIIGRVSGLNDQPAFDFAAGIFVGVVFATAYQYAKALP